MGVLKKNWGFAEGEHGENKGDRKDGLVISALFGYRVHTSH